MMNPIHHFYFLKYQSQSDLFQYQEQWLLYFIESGLQLLLMNSQLINFVLIQIYFKLYNVFDGLPFIFF